MGVLRLAVVAAAAVFVASGFDLHSSGPASRATRRKDCRSKTCDTPAFIQSEAQDAAGGELMTGAAAAEVADEEAMMDASSNAWDDPILTVWVFDDEECKKPAKRTFNVKTKPWVCQKVAGSSRGIADDRVIITALSDSEVTMERYQYPGCIGSSNEADRISFTMSQCRTLEGTKYEGVGAAAMVGRPWELILHSNPICVKESPGKGVELHPHPNLVLKAGMTMDAAGTDVGYKLTRGEDGKLELETWSGKSWVGAIDCQGVDGCLKPNTCVKLKTKIDSFISYAMVRPPPPAEKKPPFQFKVSAFSAKGCGGEGGSPSLSFQLEAAVGWCQYYKGEEKDLMITEMSDSLLTVVVWPKSCLGKGKLPPQSLDMTDTSCQDLTLPKLAASVKIERVRPPRELTVFPRRVTVSAFQDALCDIPTEEQASFDMDLAEGWCQNYDVAGKKDLKITKVSNLKITVETYAGWCHAGAGQEVELQVAEEGEGSCQPLPGVAEYVKLAPVRTPPPEARVSPFQLTVTTFEDEACQTPTAPASFDIGVATDWCQYYKDGEKDLMIKKVSGSAITVEVYPGRCTEAGPQSEPPVALEISKTASCQKLLLPGVAKSVKITPTA